MLSFPRVFRPWSPVVALAIFLPTGSLAAAHGQVVNSNNWSTVQPILARNVVSIATPPTQVPGVNVLTNGLNLTEGPFLGNGHVTAAIGGTAAEQTYTITTTDFYNQTLPKIIGTALATCLPDGSRTASVLTSSLLGTAVNPQDCSPTNLWASRLAHFLLVLP